MKKSRILFIVGIFIIILSISRILWISGFNNLSQTTIENGQLDLQDWNMQKDPVLLLDGEWEFYPSQWLIEDERQINISSMPKRFIQVPGQWNEAIQEGVSTSFGFGSYRLRLFVNPEEKINYRLHVPSVRSASALYVNGRYLAGAGEIGEREEAYKAKNLPYSATFTADDKGVIEIVIQAANFKDVRRSGIIRSIHFGSEAAIAKERNLSLSMQVLASMIFLIHSIYALVLYFLGNREKKLIYFSLLLLAITLMNLISNDEKLFALLFDVGYVWEFRLVNALIPIASLALLHCIDLRMIRYGHITKKVYTIINIAVATITLFLSPSSIIKLFPVYYLLVGVAMVLAFIAIFKKLVTDMSGNLLLLLSSTAAIHHFGWMLYWRESGISVVHYPFDLFIAIGCFASIWFKDYFTMHAETAKLAVRLQKINEHKDQFLANTSHEFKNPLHGIINMSQTVLNREKDLLKNRSVHELETILAISQRMSLLLNDLLDVASLKNGQPRLEKKRITIQPIVTGVMDMLRFLIEGKPVKFVNLVPEDFPSVIADENRVIQIIYNLLHNAVKYTNEGEICVEAKVVDGKALMIISDTGIGMDAAFMKRLFQPYEQAVDVESYGGLGLGLNISKQLVELHDGKLEVASTIGVGSNFTFSLKLATFNESEIPEDVSATEGRFPTNVSVVDNLVKETPIDFTDMEIAATIEQTILMEKKAEQLPILIVDDDPVNLEVLQSILLEEEYQITTALSGQEALEKLAGKEWSLVISDIMMPQMSGFELTSKIRERYSSTELPILLLTAISEPKNIQAGFLAGANDYVTKPVEILEFKSRVKALTTIKKVVRDQLQLEAAWLQAQIQPHFLFNSLNSIIALSSIDLDRMNDMLHNLSNFLRSKYQFQNNDGLISIEEELKLVQYYLKIEKVRFGDRLQVVWETDLIRKDIKIPFLTIQPLVENAVRHGIMKRIEGGKIIISLSVDEKHVKVSIEDDGVGMDNTQLQDLLKRKSDSRTSIGLINTNQRLIRLFGTGLQISSIKDKGTIVSFVIKF